MYIKNSFKRLILNILPEKILKIVKKVHYARKLRSVSESTELDLSVIRHLVNPGDRVIDIRANFGVYTKYLADLVGVAGRVYSIEPVPLTFEILCSNVRKLGIRNVELIKCAISDNNSRVTMEIPLYESGGENFYEARIVDDGSESSLRRVMVESKAIDSLFSELLYDISFIKCDVEGHETNCIKGGINTINKSKPAWLIEISGDPDDLDSTAHETFKLLSGKGYEAYWFDGKSLRRRCPGDKSINYFFLTTIQIIVGK
ncbi:MAG: FkbM family methyltransferase [Chloroflexi bacterium]|nr:FkbM family methyltransferase [Chloroflexota bacterium]